MGIISKQGKDALDKYSYKGSGGTPLDNIMNRFWNASVNLLPIWIAPNLVTLLGLLPVIISCVFFVIQCPNFEGSIPLWIHWLHGTSLFWYQTLDAVDGKQARRTGSSSPLGQLFDHGCDALNTTFMALGVICTVQLGASWKSFLLALSIQLPFFLAQWEEYHTHVLRTDVGGVAGVTEGQFLLILFQFLSGIVGNEVWITPITENIKLHDILLLLYLFGPAIMAYANIKNTLAFESVPNLYKITQLFPVAVCVLNVLCWVVIPACAEAVFRAPLIPFVILSMTMNHLNNIILLFALCKMPFPSFQILTLLPISTITLSSWISLEQTSFNNLSLLCLAIILFQYFIFLIRVVNELCDYLNIYCFKIKAAKKE